MSEEKAPPNLFTPDKIQTLFKDEFGKIADKFDFFEVTDYNDSEKTKALHRPGVYIIRKGDKIYKVGKSYQSSIARAKSGWMKVFTYDWELTDLTIILCNLKVYEGEDKDKYKVRYLHWVSALEIYLENNLNPHVPSKRIG